MPLTQYGSVPALLRSLLDQYWPPVPPFTLSSLLPTAPQDRVIAITGATSGVGLEVLKAIYPATNGRIWLLCRSEQRANDAIREVEALHASNSAVPPEQRPTLRFLHIDLADLRSVRAAAAALLAEETRLDLLFNIAGVGNVPSGTTTAQGLEAHLGINCVAPLLLTQLLLPLLRSAAAAARADDTTAPSPSPPPPPPGSVRVIWTASLSMEVFSPPGGVDLARLDAAGAAQALHPWRAYGRSKCGNWLLARECARRHLLHHDGVVSVAVNPGQLRTDAWRHVSKLTMLFVRPTMYEARMAALPMLYAAFAPEVAEEAQGGGGSGCYVLPWGRIAGRLARDDIMKAVENGAAERFWDWCEEASMRGLDSEK